MSVPLSKRGKQKMAVHIKSGELAVYTIKICSNEKHFPKRYRWCLTAKLTESAVLIDQYATEANAVFVTNCDEYRYRRLCQDKAIASTGFWALVSTFLQRKDTKAQMLKGLGHDRICYLGETYVKRGYITTDEYENLHDYLYEPYKKLGGNGTAAKVMQEVEKLPFREV